MRYSPALAGGCQGDPSVGVGRATTLPVSLLPAMPRQPWALESLPPFPAIALRVAQLMSKDDVHVKELSNLIRADQSLSAQLLRLANSPLFCFRFEVRTVQQAVALLGLERIQGLALTAGMQSYLAGPLNTLALQLCWRHSLAVAVAAEKLARVAFMDEDFAYTAGLLHDIGRLALIAGQPVRYAQFLAAVEDDHLLDVLEGEREWFGMDHCEAGRKLVEMWKLPPVFGAVAGSHHRKVESDKFDLVALVRTACQLADALGFAAVKPLAARSVQEVLTDLPEREMARVLPHADRLAFDIALKVNSLQLSRSYALEDTPDQ